MHAVFLSGREATAADAALFTRLTQACRGTDVVLFPATFCTIARAGSTAGCGVLFPYWPHRRTPSADPGSPAVCLRNRRECGDSKAATHEADAAFPMTGRSGGVVHCFGRTRGRRWISIEDPITSTERSRPRRSGTLSTSWSRPGIDEEGGIEAYDE